MSPKAPNGGKKPESPPGDPPAAPEMSQQMKDLVLSDPPKTKALEDDMALAVAYLSAPF